VLKLCQRFERTQNVGSRQSAYGSCAVAVDCAEGHGEVLIEGRARSIGDLATELKRVREAFKSDDDDREEI
jgi:hypothetical protein